MLGARDAKRLTAAVIVAVVLLSGPLVPFVDFTPAAAAEAGGPDAASITVVDVPSEGFRVAPARFGAGTYLYSPDATVFVESVSGSPSVIYELRVPGLGRNEVAVAFLSEADAGQDLVLELERDAVDPERVTESSYPAMVEIRVRAGNEARIVYEGNVTVTVEDLDGG